MESGSEMPRVNRMSITSDSVPMRAAFVAV